MRTPFYHEVNHYGFFAQVSSFILQSTKVFFDRFRGIKMDKMQIARKRLDGTTQSIGEHSKNVAEKMAAASRYPNTSRLIAHLHDLGKLSAAFQDYIENGGERGSVIHAWQGAFLAVFFLSSAHSSENLLKTAF